MIRRVVITGVGPVASIGLGKQNFQSALMSRKSAFKVSDQFNGTYLEGLTVAAIRDFVIRDYLPVQLRKMSKIMCRDIQLAVASSTLAMADAGFQASGTEDRSRWGCISGAGITNVEHSDIAPAFADCMEAGADFTGRWGERSINLLPPLMVLKYLPNMAGSHITIIHHLTGTSNTITCGEPSGLIAIGEGYNAVRRSTCDVALCGGSESKINSTDIVYEHIRGRLSDGEAPLGEGAGYLVLEDMQAALNRDARLLAEVKSFAVRQSHGSNGGHPVGIARAVTVALKKAQLTPCDIDMIITSGTGSSSLVKAEVHALSSIFGSDFVRKRLDTRLIYGNCHAGNSLDVTAAALLVNDPVSTLSNSKTKPRHVLVLSSNEEGQNAAILVGSVEV